jgi:hypothetical protein
VAPSPCCLRHRRPLLAASIAFLGGVRRALSQRGQNPAFDHTLPHRSLAVTAQPGFKSAPNLPDSLGLSVLRQVCGIGGGIRDCNGLGAREWVL